MTDATDQEEPKTRKVWRPSSTIGLRIPTEEDLSLADKVALLPDKERQEVLKDLDMEKLRWDVNFWARPSQLAAINSDKWLTIAVSGRGWGKTWFLAQAIHKKAMEHPGCRIALVGRSTSDVRDILIQGESGILNVINPKERPHYRPTVRRVIWPNGSEAMTFTADIPDQLRGVQFHFAFGDELGSWRVKATGGGMANAWSQLQIATRLGEQPQIYIATTPRRVPMIVDAIRMAEDRPDDVLLVRGSTYANRHLGTIYKDAVTGLYAGTSLGSQELEGELLSDVEGALLNQDLINDMRREDMSDSFWRELPKRIIGVDPTVSATPQDECGIVVFGATGERKLYRRRGYVLEDASLLGAPDVWAKRVVEMSHKYRAPVVAEDNQGGEMVRMVIQAEDPTVPVTLVKSKAGKLARAEPVAHAYQQGRVHHTDWFPELEDQLTTWAPDEGMKSPDRMDALVHAATALLVTPPKDWIGSVSVKAKGTDRHLQLVRDPDANAPGVIQAGRSRDAILERLGPTRFNTKEILEREMSDVEQEQAKKLKAVNRSSRLKLRHSGRRDAYGGPRRRPRL
ncbi:terminase [Gordonia phage Sixama]|uniref:Terminase n=1 Tax=Gordonia phage Sixama TaxID=2653271 RepID=A0A5Q2F1W0_9CAUD|nr:terminase large subunit [Gordonia phage Sixama]QGF20241.1 terminase [Gordonia phage Sixama]